jgi:hypothetical protein
VQLPKIHTDTFNFSNDNYKMSACLNFFMDGKVFAQKFIGLPALYFDYLVYLDDNLSILKGKNALFINSDKRFNTKIKLGEINPLLKTYFKTVTQLTPIVNKINITECRKFWVFYCTDYQPENSFILVLPSKKK